MSITGMLCWQRRFCRFLTGAPHKLRSAARHINACFLQNKYIIILYIITLLIHYYYMCNIRYTVLYFLSNMFKRKKQAVQ